MIVSDNNRILFEGLQFATELLSHVTVSWSHGLFCFGTVCEVHLGRTIAGFIHLDTQVESLLYSFFKMGVYHTMPLERQQVQI
jgi:hypothetical protein